MADHWDFELERVVAPDGSYVVNHLEVLGDRIAEGRFTPELVEAHWHLPPCPAT